mmetsp:Transcript_23262/g.55389  ORF Transcript_23262/g.55389 Transcript_23262/m.55389 type:complete len:228 (-) Transcript_23262:590-1273(-)
MSRASTGLSVPEHIVATRSLRPSRRCASSARLWPSSAEPLVRARASACATISSNISCGLVSTGSSAISSSVHLLFSYEEEPLALGRGLAAFLTGAFSSSKASSSSSSSSSSEASSESEAGSGEAAFFVLFGGAATAFLAAGLRSAALGAALAGFFFGASSGSDSASASASDSSSADPSAEGSSYSSLSDSATTFLGLEALPLLAPARGDLEAAASSSDSPSESSAAL